MSFFKAIAEVRLVLRWHYDRDSSACSRIRWRTTVFLHLPAGGAGKVVHLVQLLGPLLPGHPARSKCRGSASVGIGCPGLDAQHRRRVFAEPRIGAATTTASATPGIASSTSSTSRALMFSPPRMMMSDLRSVMVSSRRRRGRRRRRCDTSRRRRRRAGQRVIGVAEAQIGSAGEDLAVVGQPDLHTGPRELPSV